MFHIVFKSSGTLVGLGDRAETSPCVFFHIEKVAGPTEMPHVVELGVLVGGLR